MVRIQARRESELKLSEFMKFSMIWKIKKKPLMMRVVHEPDWKSFRRSEAQTREILLDRMESSGKKNVMYRVAEFSFAGKSLFVLFLAPFYDESFL